MPVEGDWVTIAVIAERGPVRHSKAPVGVGKENSDGAAEDDVKSLTLDAPAKPVPSQYQRWKGKAKEEPTKPSVKRLLGEWALSWDSRFGHGMGRMAQQL